MDDELDIITESNFFKSISILLENFHVINKKIFASVSLICYKLNSENRPFEDLKQFGCNNVDDTFLDHYLPFSALNPYKIPREELMEELNSDERIGGYYFICVSKVLLKSVGEVDSFYNLQKIDFSKKEFINFPLTTTKNGINLSFIVKLFEGKIMVNPFKSENQKLIKWCSEILRRKLQKWAQLPKNNTNEKIIRSLSHVDVEQYNNMYSSLKEKYGKQFVEMWTETTDPLKYVYEDVAIASFLIILWKKQSNRCVRFVDLGCGNGLLVHILNSEGHDGYGIDVRKRKIWAEYPPSTKLVEETIVPNENCIYSDADWLIGNHSDELSPWVPVMAALSSYKTSYFLLPCCAYEFNGNKYQRRNCKTSVYNDFLKYLEIISNKCEFNTLVDRLKIPSTKRVAYIGMNRKYNELDYSEKCNSIKSFIAEEKALTNNMEMKLREKTELVRNCTKMDKDVVNEIILQIFNLIISERKKINHDIGGKWRTGETISLYDISKNITKDYLKFMKAQCGGLKTLLKSKHEIFEIVGDKVKLRMPKTILEQTNKNFKFKRRPCFFYFHHPDGCPLKNEECGFQHKIDL